MHIVFPRGRKCRFFPCDVVKQIYSAMCLHFQYVCCHFWYLSSARRDSGYKWWYFRAVSDRQACVNDKDRILSLLPPFLFRLGGSVLLVELHSHCEAPKRGAFTTGKRSRDKYLVLIATVLSLLPHWLYQRHFLIGSD